MSTHTVAENRKGDIDMVYSANPISKEQLQKALEEYLENNGLPTSEEDLEDAIYDYLEDNGLPVSEDELIDIIDEHSGTGAGQVNILEKTIVDPNAPSQSINPMTPVFGIDQYLVKNELPAAFLNAIDTIQSNGGTIKIAAVTYNPGTSAVEISSFNLNLNRKTYYFPDSIELEAVIGWFIGATVGVNTPKIELECEIIVHTIAPGYFPPY